MNTENHSSLGTLTLTFLAGAAVGAVVMALVSPRSGPELRESLETLARRAKRKVGHLTEDAEGAWDELKTRSAQAAEDLKRGVAASIRDLRGSPAWDQPEASKANASEVAK
jgi:gas vesicle protein